MQPDRLEEFLAVTEELKINCTVERKIDKRRVKDKCDEVIKGKHKVRSDRFQDLEEGECTEPVNSGLSGSQQHNPTQTRRKFTNKTGGRVLKHGHSGRNGKEKFRSKTKEEEHRSMPKMLKELTNRKTKINKNIPMAPQTDSGNGENFICKFCGKSFATKGYLNFHMTSEQCL